MHRPDELQIAKPSALPTPDGFAFVPTFRFLGRQSWLSNQQWVTPPTHGSSASRLTAGAFGLLTFNDVAEIDLAIASGGPIAGPKAKENGRPDHERDHNCVPQRHGATG
jgi:hypothetical protein